MFQSLPKVIILAEMIGIKKSPSDSDKVSWSGSNDMIRRFNRWRFIVNIVKTSTIIIVSAFAAACASQSHHRAVVAAKVPEEIAAGCDLLKSPTKASILIFEPSRRRRLVCNPDRANQRFVPASTYKIPHTLIALETGVIDSVDERFTWDALDRGVQGWNRDLAVREAVSASAVWVFQTIAAEIGHDREADWIATLGYGNEDVGDEKDLLRFWLRGPTTISAQEQISFLTRLDGRSLAVSAHSIDQTVSALHLGKTAEGYDVYGKTGAVLPIDDAGILRSGDGAALPDSVERTGWFVGWIARPEARGGAVYFAYNVDLEIPGTMATRISDTFAILGENNLPVLQ